MLSVSLNKTFPFPTFDRWNVLIYILQQLTFEINLKKWGIELLISEITGSTHFRTKNVMLIFTTSYLSFKYLGIYYTNTISNQTTDNYRPHKPNFMTTRPLTYVTNGIQGFEKCCIKRWVHFDLRPDMLFGGLQPFKGSTNSCNK